MGVVLNVALLKENWCSDPRFHGVFLLKGIMIDRDLKMIISTLDFLIHDLI